MPEVDIAKYQELKNYNSSTRKQFNSWLELFVPLRPGTFDAFCLLVARLWNERVVATRVPQNAASQSRPPQNNIVYVFFVRPAPPPRRVHGKVSGDWRIDESFDSEVKPTKYSMTLGRKKEEKVL